MNRMRHIPRRPLAAPCGSSSTGAPGGDSGPLADASAFDATSLESAAPEDAAAPPDSAADAIVSQDAPGADAGPAITAAITVDPATTLGAIGPEFVGLSYEKSHLEDGFFRGGNAALVAMLDLLGPSIL